MHPDTAVYPAGIWISFASGYPDMYCILVKSKTNHASRARRARAGLTVYPPWIQIRDVVIASSRSCDRKSKFGLRHAIKLIELYCMTKSEF